jgi:hypothetical protein
VQLSNWADKSKQEPFDLLIVGLISVDDEFSIVLSCSKFIALLNSIEFFLFADCNVAASHQACVYQRPDLPAGTRR